jgi:cobalt-zinc-cadmium efflux system membrane fusion protein
MTVWATADRRRFVQRIVKTGLIRDKLTEISEGLQIGELVATGEALFISDWYLNSGS